MQRNGGGYMRLYRGIASAGYLHGQKSVGGID
jgi:hypothetical protein